MSIKKKRIGISIYPEKVGEKETIDFIKEVHSFGLNRIFANLLMVKDDKEGREGIEMRTRVFKVAKDLGFEIILDVNPKVYKEFKLDKTELNFFHKMNVTGIRLDEDFGGEVEAELSNNKLGMKIEINASAATTTIDNAMKHGANKENLIVCHNFYPMQYTGLNYERFLYLSKYFDDLGLDVAAFITLQKEQNGVGPWDVNDGMPTLEMDRFLDISDQARHLLAIGTIKDIIISQHKPEISQLESLKKLLDLGKDLIYKFDIYPGLTKEEKTILDYGKHVNRIDINDFFIRSTMTRVIYKDMSIAPRNNNKPLKRGDVVVLNDLFGRYKGELHIVTTDMPADKRKNSIGRVTDFDMNILDFATPGREFGIIMEEKNGK